MNLGLSLGLGMLRGGGFNPLTLFAAGEQGAWYDPSDITTLFQDTAGTTPVAAAGQSVGLMLDKSGRGNHATQANVAQRPLYQVNPTRLTIDRVDDRLVVTVPTGGFVGTMVLATPEGTAAYGVNIPAGSFDIGGVGGLYFPGSAIVGQIIRDGAMSQAQIDSTIAWLRDKGGGLDYGSAAECRIKNCAGYNPFGFISAPAVPASNTPITNLTGVDVMVYLTGGTLTGNVEVNGHGVLQATNTGYFLPAGGTIKLTYSAAPTWTWNGL